MEEKENLTMLVDNKSTITVVNVEVDVSIGVTKVVHIGGLTVSIGLVALSIGSIEDQKGLILSVKRDVVSKEVGVFVPISVVCLVAEPTFGIEAGRIEPVSSLGSVGSKVRMVDRDRGKGVPVHDVLEVGVLNRGLSSGVMV